MMDVGVCEFHVDLLTSFDARSPGGGSGGVLSIEDGVLRFRRLVADGSVPGPLIVRVILRLDADTLLVSDATSGLEMDRFPLSMIGQVSVVSSSDGRSFLHNMLTFTVLEDAFHMAPPEMYFFQSHDVPVCSASLIYS